MKNFPNDVNFTEVEYGHNFYARVITDGDWGKQFGATHVVVMNQNEFRYAEIGATVAYVYVDEDEWGVPVKEKWAIKHF